MEVLDAFNISLAIYNHQQMESEGHPSHLTDFLTEGNDLEELWYDNCAPGAQTILAIHYNS